MTRRMALLAALLLAPGIARAQDWAKARLENSPRHLEFVKVDAGGGRQLTCFVAYPERKEKAPAVVVIHEIFGLSDWVRGVCDQLAEAGYVAIAPDLLSGMGPNGGGTDAFQGGDAVRKAIVELPADRVLSDLDAAAAYVTKLPASDGTVSVAGFCWGGGQAFRYAAHNPKLTLACVFYGPSPAAEELAKVTAPVLGFYAANDARINAGLAETENGMKAAGKRFEPVIYEGAGHGFMRAGEAPDANPANAKARARRPGTRWKAALAQKP